MTKETMMQMGLDPEYPFVVFRLSDSVYAVTGQYVRSMELLGEVTPVAGSPEAVRGIIRYRSQYMPLIDFRMVFGLPDQKTEMEEKINFQQRIRDHEEWVQALERTVKEGTPFLLTEDPHQCALGRWLDTFTTSNNELALHLKRIDLPHRAVHETAAKVKALLAAGEQEKAEKLVQEMRRTHFKETLDLLSHINEAYERGLHEMIIVIDNGDTPCGMLVDEVLSVEYIEDVWEKPGFLQADSVLCVGRRKHGDEDVLILDCESLKNRLMGLNLQQLSGPEKETPANDAFVAAGV